MSLNYGAYAQTEVSFVFEEKSDSLRRMFSYSNKYFKLIRSDSLAHDSINIISEDFKIKYSNQSFYIKPKRDLCLKDTFLLDIYRFDRKGDSVYIKTEKFYNVLDVGFVLGNLCEDTTTIDQILLQDSLHFFYGKTSKPFTISSYAIIIISSKSKVIEHRNYGPIFTKEQKDEILALKDIQTIIFHSIRVIETTNGESLEKRAPGKEYSIIPTK